MNTETQTPPPRPRRKGLAVAAFLGLALAFTAVGAVLIVGKGVLVDELPFRHPSRQVLFEGTFTDDTGEAQEWAISQMDFADWQKESRSFEQMAVFTSEYTHNLSGEHPERLNAELVSHNYFPMLGARIAAGRFFLPEEDREPFRDAVTVLSYGLWQRCCGGDEAIVGRTVELNGRPYKVVGVAAEEFRGLSDAADLWVPSMMPASVDALGIRRWRWASVIGTLKPGVTLEQAQSEMDRITAGLAQRYPEMNQGMGVRLTYLREHWFGKVDDEVRSVAWAAALLLLFAAATAAVLLRGGGTVAGGTIVGAVSLTLAAAVLGLVLAAWAVRALAPVSGLGLPSFVRLSPGVPGTAAALGLALLCGLAVGLASRAAGRGAGWKLFQGAVVLVQAVLALFLLVSAYRVVRGYRALVGQDLRFDPGNLLTLRIDPRGPKYDTDEPINALVPQYLSRLGRIAGVQTVGMGGPAIPTDNWSGGYMTVEEKDNPDSPDGTWFVMMHAVSPSYFKALGVPILQGSDFTMNDKVPFGAIVSKGLAERNWPGQNPIGKRYKFGVRNNPNRPWRTVIGVVPDIRHDGYRGMERPAPDVYIPNLRFQVRLPLTLNFLVKARDGVSAESLIPAVEREIQALSPDVPPYDAMTMEERLDRQVRKERLEALLTGFFALAAVALTAAAAWGAAGGRSGREAVSARDGAAPGMPAAASR